MHDCPYCAPTATRTPTRVGPAREADALAAMPVAIGNAVAEPQLSPSALTAGGVPPVVVGEAVAVVDDNERRPKGGVAALMNTLRIS